MKGFGDEARRVKAAWDAGSYDDAIEGVSDDVLAKLTFFGPREEIKRRIEDYASLRVCPILY